MTEGFGVKISDKNRREEWNKLIAPVCRRLRAEFPAMTMRFCFSCGPKPRFRTMDSCDACAQKDFLVPDNSRVRGEYEAMWKRFQSGDGKNPPESR